ncbi:MAG: hypothetical protein QGF74_01770 [Candidatus Nanoarchaeia archaeon]|nr:hypothetical protein [Candidatus Nanoarchaeia archaeon]
MESLEHNVFPIPQKEKEHLVSLLKGLDINNEFEFISTPSG